MDLQKALRVDAARCAEMRRVWLQACAAALPDLKSQERLEAELQGLLAAHDSTSNDSFRSIVATGWHRLLSSLLSTGVHIEPLQVWAAAYCTVWALILDP